MQQQTVLIGAVYVKQIQRTCPTTRPFWSSKEEFPRNLAEYCVKSLATADNL